DRDRPRRGVDGDGAAHLRLVLIRARRRREAEERHRQPGRQRNSKASPFRPDHGPLPVPECDAPQPVCAAPPSVYTLIEQRRRGEIHVRANGRGFVWACGSSSGAHRPIRPDDHTPTREGSRTPAGEVAWHPEPHVTARATGLPAPPRQAAGTTPLSFEETPCVGEPLP